MKHTLNTSALVTADSPKGQRATETFRAQYNKARLTEETAQILNERPGFAAYLLAGIRRFSLVAPNYWLAQSILGLDFITPEEVAKNRPGLVYNQEQIAALIKTIPSVEVLEWCKENGYVLLPAPPTALSTFEVRALNPDLFYLKTGGRGIYKDFASNDKTPLGWLMIKKIPAQDSVGWTFDTCIRRLSPPERIPNAAEMSWFITTYFEVRCIRLFELVFVWTSSVDSEFNNHPVSIGRFDLKGVTVRNTGDRGSFPEGISAARVTLSH